MDEQKESDNEENADDSREIYHPIEGGIFGTLDGRQQSHEVADLDKWRQYELVLPVEVVLLGIDVRN